jgi:hypothetical protein
MKIIQENLLKDEFFKTASIEYINESLDDIENFITQKISF